MNFFRISRLFVLFVDIAQFFSNAFFIKIFAYLNSVDVCLHKDYNIYVSKQLFRCVFHVYFSHLHAPA